MCETCKQHNWLIMSPFPSVDIVSQTLLSKIDNKRPKTSKVKLNRQMTSFDILASVQMNTDRNEIMNFKLEF